MKPKIIIVENELLIALDIKNILEQDGYEVIINITTAEQALIALGIHQPDLILIETHLGENKEGVKLARFLNKISSTPIVFISSFSNQFTIEELNEISPNSLIMKPYKVLDIKTTVGMALHNIQSVKC